MNKKILVLPVTFFTFLFLGMNVKGDCCYPCSSGTVGDFTCNCGAGYRAVLGACPTGWRSCIIGPDLNCGGGFDLVSSCSYGNRICRTDACPATSQYNGADCTVRKDCFDLGCYAQTCSGKWDASNQQCVVCSGKIKTKRLGSSSGIDVACGNCDGYDIADKCEQACGAPSGLDEQPLSTCKLKDISISGSKVSGSCGSAKVVNGSSISFSFYYSGSYPDVSYTAYALYRDNICETWGGSSYRADLCTWYSGSIPTTAPSTTGSYTYYVKCSSKSQMPPDIPTPCANPSYYTWLSSVSCSIQVVECLTDADCSGYDPSSHLKLVCDCPSASCSYPKSLGSDDYRCKPLPKCDIKEQCAPDWCCTADPALPAECKDAIGSCVNESNTRCNNRYLCDPPGWSNEKTLDEKQTNNLFDLILNFFQSLFIR